VTGLIVLSFVPFLVAVGFFLRLRAEQRRRRALEQQLRDVAALDAALDWLPVLAHELRTPIAAVLGYQELMQEGTFGEVTPAAADALARIGAAGEQLVSLVDGLDRLGSQPDDFDDVPVDTDARTLIDGVIEQIRADALARDITLDLHVDAMPLRTRTSEAARALCLALGAAMKASPGATLRISTRHGDVPAIRIAGTRLDPQRDNARSTIDAAASGPALRILLARRTIALAGGDIIMVPGANGADLVVTLPSV